jgi:hypothetical protein
MLLIIIIPNIIIADCGDIGIMKLLATSTCLATCHLPLPIVRAWRKATKKTKIKSKEKEEKKLKTKREKRKETSTKLKIAEL